MSVKQNFPLLFALSFLVMAFSYGVGETTHSKGLAIIAWVCGIICGSCVYAAILSSTRDNDRHEN